MALNGNVKPQIQVITDKKRTESCGYSLLSSNIASRALSPCLTVHIIAAGLDAFHTAICLGATTKHPS